MHRSDFHAIESKIRSKVNQKRFFAREEHLISMNSDANFSERVRSSLADNLHQRHRPYRKFGVKNSGKRGDSDDKGQAVPLQAVIDEQVKIWYDGSESSD